MDKNKNLVLFSPQIEIFTPFAGYVDASRLNMSSKQINQNCISSNTDTPIVIDKYYQKVTKINSPFAEFAIDEGHILLSDLDTIIIYYKNLKKLVTKSVPPSKKMINNALCLKYKVDVGPISEGDLLFDYTNMDPKTFLPKIGYRARILFSSFFGYTADDAMVISEGFAKKAEIEYNQKIFIPITKEWKYLRNHIDTYLYKKGQTQEDEAYIKYFPIDLGDHFMAEIHNISEQQSMFFTKNVPGIKGGNIISTKVHRNTDKSFEELKEEYLYTPGLIDEISNIYSENHKIVPAVEQVLTQLGLESEKVQSFSKEIFESHYSTKKFPKNFEDKLKDEFNLDPASVDFLLEITVEKKVKTTRGDKFTNLFAGKGVVSMIIPDEIMPIDPETGEKIDIIFNPLGIFGRNNWGSIFELALSKITKDIEKIASTVIEEENINIDNASKLLARISFIAENFIKKYDDEYYHNLTQRVLPGITSAMMHENFSPIFELADDINKKGFYLFVPNFPKIPYTDFFNNFIEPYGIEFGVNFNKTQIKYDKELIKWLRDKWQYKNSVFGDEVYETEIGAFIGMNYMLKLYHTSYSKFTSVSLANSYSKITGQPARGRKKTGGQHISWQTLAALLGHKENSGILKELYTIKSDAPLKDKEKFLMQYITHGDYKLKPKYTSLTKRAVNNALKILGMQLEE